MASLRTFSEVLRAAIADFEAHGFDSEERLEKWRNQLAHAADGHTAITSENLKRTLTSVFTTQVTNGGLLRAHNIPAWKFNQLAPKLQRELERRIMASAQLIKLNREEMVARTIRRFSGWATSVPIGGSEVVNRKETSDSVKKALKSLPFEERRVMIDQAAKFKAQLSNIVASETGAIAAVWRSHHAAVGYNARPEHAKRDGKIFAIRGNWAIEKGLMKAGDHQFTDDIEMPAEFVYCQCRYRYLYNLRDLPDDMLTDKGMESIKRGPK